MAPATQRRPAPMRMRMALWASLHWPTSRMRAGRCPARCQGQVVQAELAAGQGQQDGVGQGGGRLGVVAAAGPECRHDRPPERSAAAYRPHRLHDLVRVRRQDGGAGKNRWSPWSRRSGRAAGCLRVAAQLQRLFDHRKSRALRRCEARRVSHHRVVNTPGRNWRAGA